MVNLVRFGDRRYTDACSICKSWLQVFQLKGTNFGPRTSLAWEREWVISAYKCPKISNDLIECSSMPPLIYTLRKPLKHRLKGRNRKPVVDCAPSPFMPVQNVTIYKQFTSSGANAVINRTDTHLKQSVRPYRYLLNTKLHPSISGIKY